MCCTAASAQPVSLVHQYTGLPFLDDVVRVKGIAEEATIARDKRGMPSISALTFADAAFAQGFAHAQDRMFQMDLFRRVPAGRVAALVGPGAVGADIAQRRLGFDRVANRMLAQATPSERVWLASYAAGVNAGLASLAGDPPEYQLLGVAPEPWRERDSALVALLMFIALAGDYESERIGTAIAETLPASVAAFVLPDRQRFDAAMTGRDWQPSDATPIPTAADLDWRGLAPEDFGPREADPWPIDTVPTEDTLVIVPGSNAWAVGSDRTSGATTSGGALLASDMHLPLALPGIWYPVELNWGGGGFTADVRTSTPIRGQAVGLSLPGVPGVTTGSNGLVAWAATNLIADVRDRVLIEGDPNRFDWYRTPDGWTQFDRRVEMILVRGSEPFFIDVVETIWGPVLERSADGRMVAVAWSPLRDGAADLASLGYMFADNVHTAADIAAKAGGPPLNMIFADSAGSVGWVVSGWLPKRDGVDGLLSSSWTDGRGWRGNIDPRDRPALILGPDGMVWNSNNRGGSLDSMGVVGRLFVTPERAHRVRDLLRAGDAFDESAFLAMQYDVRTEGADFYAEQLASAFDGVTPADADVRTALALAMTYDGSASAESRGYRPVRSFRHTLARELIGQLVVPVLAAEPDLVFWPPSDEPVRRLLEARPAHLLPPGHADWDAYLRGAFMRAVRTMAGETGIDGRPLPLDAAWGEVNRLNVVHPVLAAVPAEIRPFIAALSAPHHQQAGDVTTVRVARPGFGSSCQFVVMPGREAAGVLTIPGGISGNPFSPHFKDRHAAWAAGTAEPLLVGPPEQVVTLRPAGVAD